jgi:DnaJ-domain-containing protein 1
LAGGFAPAAQPPRSLVGIWPRRTISAERFLARRPGLDASRVAIIPRIPGGQGEEFFLVILPHGIHAINCERPRRPVRENALLLWRNEQSDRFCNPFLPKFWVLIRQHGMRTHYETLGIGREASPTQIKRAYRSLAKLCHPDLFASGSAASAEAEKRMKQINMAYAVLSNPHRRETYDKNLRVKESHYSELNPEHCAKCGQLTLYWHTERKVSLCEACRRVGR